MRQVQAARAFFNPGHQGTSWGRKDQFKEQASRDRVCPIGRSDHIASETKAIELASCRSAAHQTVCISLTRSVCCVHLSGYDSKWSESSFFFISKYDSISLKAVLRTEGTSSPTYTLRDDAWEQFLQRACVRTSVLVRSRGVVSEEMFQPDTPKSIHTRTKAMQAPYDS